MVGVGENEIFARVVVGNVFHDRQGTLEGFHGRARILGEEAGNTSVVKLVCFLEILVVDAHDDGDGGDGRY